MHNNSETLLHWQLLLLVFSHLYTSCALLLQSKPEIIFHLNCWICIADWDQRLLVTTLVWWLHRHACLSWGWICNTGQNKKAFTKYPLRMARETQEARRGKFLLQKPLSCKTSRWGKQMTNSWISQIAFRFYAHGLIDLTLIFHMEAHSSCSPPLLWETVKFRSSLTCCLLTQSPACSETSYFRITWASSNHSLVSLLRYPFWD